MNALTNLKCTLALSAGFCSSFANAQKQPHIILIMSQQHTCPCRIVDRNVAVASRNVRIWTGSAEV